MNIVINSWIQGLYYQSNVNRELKHTGKRKESVGQKLEVGKSWRQAKISRLSKLEK